MQSVFKSPVPPPGNYTPPTPQKREAQTPQQQLVEDWQPEMDMADVAVMEQQLDEAVQHVANLLKLIPLKSGRTVVKARQWLAQFKSPV